MMQSVQNLRIGTKLAVTSLLTILLVGAMVLAEMSGNAAVRQKNEASSSQETLVRIAVEMKAAIRGLMIGGRDIRSAKTEAEMQTARDLLALRQKSTLGYVNEALKLVKSAESRERLLKIEGLAGRYVAATADIVAVRNEIIASEAKGGGGALSSTIAAAVEEQGAATQEISLSVQQAAQGTQQVSANIADVQRGAGETGSASSQVLSAAQSLSGDSNRLKLEVDRFLNTVRAA
jgi:hypothetical protein